MCFTIFQNPFWRRSLLLYLEIYAIPGTFRAIYMLLHKN